jgi:hypothetical protein
MHSIKYTREQLLQKQKQGTLTRDEKVDYLVQVRGMLRSDAIYIVDAKYRFEAQLKPREDN